MDVYVALELPDGSMLFYPGYTSDIVPVLHGFNLKADYHMPPPLLHDVALPSTLPPVDTAQPYKFLAAVTETGTFNFLTSIVEAPFSYENTAQAPVASEPADGSHDGNWYGTGGSSVVSEDCPGLADVVFEISNNLVSGMADEAVEVDADGYEITAKVQGDLLADGVLWEDYKAQLVAVGAFTGTFDGDRLSGTWYNTYGCSGTYSLT